MNISIRELWVYPVKSLGGARVEQAAITAAGSLALDREWIVVDATTDKMVWQGDIPRMTLVRVALDDAPGVILTTNIVNCPVDAVDIDDRVRVTFEAQDGIWYPLFEKTA